MDREKIIDELRELGVDVELDEDGLHIAAFVHDSCLQAFLELMLITEKIDNS